LQALLDLHPYVRVILASAPLASANETEEFAAWLRTVPDSHIKEWSSQPGNYQLMTKQGELTNGTAAQLGMQHMVAAGQFCLQETCKLNGVPETVHAMAQPTYVQGARQLCM
jgi:hypothetical protein